MQENIAVTNKEAQSPVDFAAIPELNNQEQKLKSKTSYIKAYAVSIFFPPFGLFYFIKYFFFGEGNFDDRKAAIICVILTVVSIVLSVLTLHMFFNQAINLNDRDLNILKELITPENQNTLRELLQ
ncbi:hypothetical protein A2W14_03055 [Candidatus Gottesmanbacteria bacterium RBG_16_37_8]|uniref:Uncharacterized protein n=1 Tax=Candidatus Gottesmanbacteria bacterium RBG_16_37_8 TaxID=1798371 RepID=A0A1F5YTK5_9BACT|nr:MAG: hypothetical protein A2W14_03055 [Candidatus Gottesmanbacteria bacterium RBG_16_37_8]